MWHACLLLALFMWRAARADKQLPPVMAAAWAGCDAVWELVQASEYHKIKTCIYD